MDGEEVRADSAGWEPDAMNLHEALVLEAAIEGETGLWHLLWDLRSLQVGIRDEEAIANIARATRSLLARGLIELSEARENLDPERTLDETEWDAALSASASWAPKLHVGPWYVVTATPAGELLNAEASRLVLEARRTDPSTERP